MTRVFISYARDDGSDFAKRVAQEFEKNELPFWLDVEAIGAGEDWPRKIDEALRDSFALALIITPKAMDSDYVTYEWIYALGRGIRLIPMLCRDTANLHPKLKQIHYWDFTAPTPAAWNKLVDELLEVQKAYDPYNLTYQLSPKIPRFVQNALDELEDTKEHVRRGAIDNLATSDHPAAHEAIVTTSIQHHRPDVRIHAAFTLVDRFNDKRAIKGLLDGLRSERDDDRNRASRMLKQFGDEGVPGLLEALNHPSSETRHIAAKTLGELIEKSTLPDLIRLLDDPNSKVVGGALNAIDLINDPIVIPALKLKLNNADEYVQLRIASILLKFGDHSVQSVLLTLLGRGEVNNIGHPAARMLIHIGQEVVPRVIEVLRNDTKMFARALAADILGELRAVSAIPNLIEAVDDKEPYVRGRAAIALSQLGVTNAVDKLEKLLYDEDGNAFHGGKWALEQIDTPAAREALERWRLKRDKQQ